MADDKQGTAKNKMGELFVDIGSTGLGTLIKGLNTISASFMLAKNGAKQMSDMIIKPAKEAGNAAVEIGKVANALGTSNKEVQKMQMYLKSKNASESLLNDLANLKQIIYDVHTGMGQLPEGMSVALNRTGHNIMEYSGTFESTLKLLDDIRNATKGMNAEARNQIFRQMGMSSEWGYLWDRGDFNLKDAALISDDAIEKNIQAAEAMAKLAATTESLKIELIGKIAPALTTIANWLSNKEVDLKSGKYNNQINTVKTGTTNASKTISKGVGSAVMATPIGTAIVAGGAVYAIGKQLKDTAQKGRVTGGAAPILEMPKPLDIANNNETSFENKQNLQSPENMQSSTNIPSQMYQNLTQSTHIEITNQNTINGDNASEIANRIASINSQDIAYNQFQAHNLAGI